MRKQNRNNRICTNEESGKTDFIIDPLLPIGKGSTYNVTAQVNRRTLFDLVLEEGKVRRTVTGRNPFETV